MTYANKHIEAKKNIANAHIAVELVRYKKIDLLFETNKYIYQTHFTIFKYNDSNNIHRGFK
jgi:hypothetical protein